MLRYLTTFLDVAGAGLVVAGVALVYVPAALVVAGVAVLATSYRLVASAPIDDTTEAAAE